MECFAADMPRPAVVVGAICDRDVPALPASPHRGCKPLPQRRGSRQRPRDFRSGAL